MYYIYIYIFKTSEKCLFYYRNMSEMHGHWTNFKTSESIFSFFILLKDLLGAASSILKSRKL